MHWYASEVIDTYSFELVSSGKTHAEFRKSMRLMNYSGTVFNIDVNRTIKILTKQEVSNILNISLSDNVKFVAYQSINKMKNKSGFDWTKEKGLLSIWILGMYKSSGKTNVVIPAP